jgi:hypothetical protein
MPRLFLIGDASRSAVWPAEQGGRKHGLTGIAAISADASKSWRSARTGSLASANVGLRVGFRFVRQRRTRSVKHHAFGPFMIRMDPDVDPGRQTLA